MCNIGKVHETSIIIILSHPKFISQIGMQIRQRMDIVIPPSKTTIQPSPKDDPIINHHSLVVMGPVKGIFQVGDFSVVRVTHDFDHMWVLGLESLDGVEGVGGGDKGDVIVDNAVNVDSTFCSSAAKTAQS
jgi:hypothetical protein